MIGSWSRFGWFGLGQRTSGLRNRDVELEAKFGPADVCSLDSAVELEASGVRWDSSGSQWNNRSCQRESGVALPHTTSSLSKSF